jgi:hypothetical protein
LVRQFVERYSLKRGGGVDPPSRNDAPQSPFLGALVSWGEAFPLISRQRKEMQKFTTKAPRHQGTKTPRKGRKLIVLVLRVVLVAARNNKKSRGFLPWPEIREALIAGGNQLPTDCVPR